METTPRRIGRFEVIEPLGRGAMGVVYKAHDPHIDRIVAIKLVRADLLDGDDRSQYLARFNNEARMAGRCLHPNIVAIHDFSEHEGNPFLVQEFVDGRDLGRAYSSGTQVDVAEATKIVLQVLDALDCAHGLGVIHRDIKPANILLTTSQGLKVTDFGISRASAADATMSSMLVGTPCYMSPEQCLSDAADVRSDLFSLGCVLYELLAGQRAFAAPNYVATMHKLIHDDPPPLADLRPGLQPNLVHVVDRALAKRATDRYADARSMVAALRDALGPESSQAGSDRTIIVPRPFASSGGSADVAPSREADTGVRSTGSDGFDLTQSRSFSSIERRLAHHIGPLARYQLRRALKTARSPDELCAVLAGMLPDPGMARSFIRETRSLIEQDPEALALLSRTKGASRAQKAPISDAAISEIVQALAHILGPIAPRMLRRILPRVDTLPGLLEACMEQIEPLSEKQRFRYLTKDLWSS